MENKEEYIFLLGGHDLEMEEIRKILDDNEIKYEDNHLQWGAKLSEYKDKFDDVHHFVGVELVADCIPPKCYTEIDHHNEKSHLSSSIEQVAEMLEIKLNRWQQLVAANDKGYIPAMETLGASKDEIKEIRQKDKTAQGITCEDEKLAMFSIKNHLIVKNGITIIKAINPGFSVITDQLYPYDHLLIYTETALTYYGNDVSILIHTYKKLIVQKKAYYRGNKEGFFGLTKDGIDILGGSNSAVNQIIKILSDGK